MATGLTPDLLLRAYAAGIFPMAGSADDPELYWVDPVRRGILPLDKFHLPKRLARTVRSDRFSIACDHDFVGVMRGCAESTAERPQTWINDEILAVYNALYKSGHAHSVEAYSDGALVGGLYGVSLGGAFFGESMFSRVTDASKVALAHLMARLIRGGYRLLDTQFVTDHLLRFGTIEISRARYRRLLAEALKTEAYFPMGGLTGVEVSSVLQSSTLIS
ncbi:MAG TPA: leucyl/phenylalanyl-tRNA--protein transferase [Stellaceae bacterium]|jgi:leucyl/phenylalanyl-tRNA--protein transferase|nr:leucyl/phenylalanyl-tRNA--protein transferase [Stellaceae bacterium]